MSKLNQIIAVEKGVKSRAAATLDQLYKRVQKSTLFQGINRVYRPKDENGETLPPERQIVQNTIIGTLSELRASYVDVVDIIAHKDTANMRAQAEVTIEGELTLPPLPVTTLLFLEKNLTDMRTFVEAFPVLDSAESWTFDRQSGIWNAEAVETHRTKKVQKPLVLYPATDKHPAQTQMITEDEIAGFWRTVKQSGAMPRTQKDAIIARIDKLLLAVKEARERANDIDAGDRPKVGAPIFEFLFRAE